jgi:PAS domain S-box-containing protein
MTGKDAGRGSRWFTAPSFADPDKTLAARQVFTIVRAFILSSVLLQAVLISLAPTITGRWLALLLATVAVSLVVLALNRRGRVRAAALLLVISLWLLIGAFVWTQSGLGARAAWGYFIVVFIAGLVLGKWPGIIAATICSASTLFIALAAPVASSDPVRFWLVNTLYLAIVLLLQDLAGRSIRESLARTGSEFRERLLAQAALFESERKHRELINSLPFCVFEADLQGRFTFVNQTALEWFGFSRDEFLAGLSIVHVLAEKEVLLARENLKRIANGEEISIHEYEARRKDGRIFTALIRTRPIFEKGVSVGVQGSLIDISDRKQVEMERERIVSMLKATLESTTDGILVVDLEGRITDYNAHFAKMWQIPDEILALRSDDDAIASVHSLLVDPEGFVARVRQIYEDSMQESYDLLIFKDGRYIECYSRPQLLNGHAVGRVWSHRDISERMRAERGITVWKQRFESAVIASDQIVYDYHFASGEILWSGSIKNVLGYELEEMGGGLARWLELIAPADRDEAVRLLNISVQSGAPYQVEYGFQHKDAHFVTVLDRGFTIRDHAGRPERMIGMMQDITERKRAELALKESEYRYRMLFEAASDAIFVMKGAFFFDCNSKTLEMFACTREQIINASPARFSPPLQADGRSSSDKAQEKIQAAYAGQPQFFEWTHLRADDTPFLAEVSLTRIDLAADVFLLAMVRDISERKKLEEQLLQAQKMEAIGILAGGVAHDFNNILSTIVGYGSLLQMKLQPGDPQKEYVERILAASERAANLTGSLLTFSRKQEAELLPIDLNDAIYGFHKVLARLIGEDIDFNLELDSRSLVADADIRQVEQVLMNLVNNSRDAMPRGGQLTIATASVILETDSRGIPCGSYAAIAVTDTGMGMDQEIQGHIFEPFFTTKEVGKGTGLGLAIAYGIVKKHSGFITVDSVPGKGTTVTVYLPLKSLPKLGTGRRKSDRIPRGSETILLIEDDLAVRQVTRSLLEEFGYTVLEAEDGIAAQEVFRRNREWIALVLCDLIMPKLNGRETLAAIQQINNDIKVIFMSGYTADTIANKGITDSRMHLLLKPLNPGVLLNKVRSVLDGG